MTATLAEIRAGIAANIAAAISNVQVSAYLLGNPTTPSVMVGGPDEVTFDTAFGGVSDWTLPVLAYVGMATDLSAQKNLDVYLASSGTGSMKSAIELDPTLGGKVDSVRVASASGYRQYLMESNVIYLGCEWTCEIFNKA